MTAEARFLQIADGDEVLTLNYLEALDFHGRDAWFGVAVAFRMLQAAGRMLSGERLWNRSGIYIVSNHPGRGVRDCIQYVTRCVTRGHYRLPADVFEERCTSAMQFSWEVGDGSHIARIVLRPGLVPRRFYELLDRHGTPAERAGDAGRLADLKRQLVERVWSTPIGRLFDTELDRPEQARHA